MPIAKGISKLVAIKKESTYGTLAGATGGRLVRRVTSSFNLTKEAYQSDEIRTDYQMSDFRHGVRSADGSVSGELSPGSYSDLFAAALARAFAAPGVCFRGAGASGSADGQAGAARALGQQRGLHGCRIGAHCRVFLWSLADPQRDPGGDRAGQCVAGSAEYPAEHQVADPECRGNLRRLRGGNPRGDGRS